MHQALRTAALYSRWCEPVIHPRRTRVIPLKTKGYVSFVICVPGSDLFLQREYNGGIYLGTYEDVTPSFLLPHPSLREGQPGYSILCKRVGRQDSFALKPSNAKPRLQWTSGGWVFSMLFCAAKAYVMNAVRCELQAERFDGLALLKSMGTETGLDSSQA